MRARASPIASSRSLASRSAIPAPGARPRLDVRVAALASVDEKGAEGLLRRAEVGAQAKLELRVRQAKLALLSLGDRRTGLQVLEGHAQLPGEDPKRLEGGLPLT